MYLVLLKLRHWLAADVEHAYKFLYTFTEEETQSQQNTATHFHTSSIHTFPEELLNFHRKNPVWILVPKRMM